MRPALADADRSLCGTRLPHTGVDEFQGDVHPRGGLFRRHPAVEKAPADRPHGFAHLDDVPVRVVKTDDPLPPGVLFDRMDRMDVAFAQAENKVVEIFCLKIKLEVIPAKRDPVGADKISERLGRLQGQASSQCFVFPEIQNDMEPEHFLVKGHGPVHVGHYQHGTFQFHRSSSAVCMLFAGVSGPTGQGSIALLYSAWRRLQSAGAGRLSGEKPPSKSIRKSAILGNFAGIPFR